MFAIKGPISFLTPVISCCHLLKVPFPHSLWSATLFMPNSKCKVIIGLHSVPEFVYPYTSTTGLPSWLNGNESTCSVGTLQEARVQSLGWENPPEEGMATHSSILAWRIPWTEDLAGSSPWGHRESDTTEWLSTRHTSTTLP